VAADFYIHATVTTWSDQAESGHSYTWEIDDYCIQQFKKLKKQAAIETIKNQPFF